MTRPYAVQFRATLILLTMACAPLALGIDPTRPATQPSTRPPPTTAPVPRLMVDSVDQSFLAVFIDGGATLLVARGRALSLYRLADAGHPTDIDGAATAAIALAVNADESMAATGSYSNFLTVVNLKQREIVARIRHENSVTGVAFAPDGKTAITGDIEGVVRSFDIASQKLCWQISPGLGSGARFVPAPDRRTFLALGQGEDMFLMDFAGKVLATFHGHRHVEQQPFTITGIAFGPEGKTLISGGADKTVRVWDAGTGKELYMLGGALGGPIAALAFLPRNNMLAVADGVDLRFWALPAREPRGRIPKSGVRALALNPDGTELALADATGVHLLDAITGHETAVFEGPKDGPTGVFFSPDGRTIVTMWPNFKVRLWDVSGAKR